jgi:potassium efflux system protein
VTRAGTLLCAAAAAVLLLPLLSLAQPAVDSETLSTLRASVEADTTLDDTRRAALLEDLGAAEEALAKAEAERQGAQALQQTLDTKDQQLADYRRRIGDIEGARATLESRLGPAPGLEAIEAEIALIESQRDSWTGERRETLDTLASVASNSGERRDRLSTVTDSLQEFEDALSAGGESLEARVDSALRGARVQALRAEQDRLQLALRGEPVLNSIRTARVAWLDAAIAEADALLIELSEAAAARRQSAVQQRSAETRRLLESLPSVPEGLQQLASENLALVDEAQTLARQIEEARVQLAQLRDGREAIEQDAALTERRLEVAGLEAELGDVMLSRLSSLPDERAIASRSSERNSRIAETSLAAIDTEQVLRARADRASYLDAALENRELLGPRGERVARQLYEQQRELLTENLQAQNALLRLLVDGNQASDELQRTVIEYRDFLTGNLLWTSNYSYLKPQQLNRQLSILAELRPPADVPAYIRRVVGDPLTLLFALALLVLTVRQRRVREALTQRLGKPISPSTESGRLLLGSLLLTLLRVLPTPLLLALLGRLVILDTSSVATQAVGAGLYAAAVTLLSINLLSRLANRHGAGRRLLKWNSGRADALTRDLRWLRPLLVAGAVLTTIGRGLTGTDSGGPMAAAGSLTLAVLLAIGSLRLLRSGQFGGDALSRLGLRIVFALSLAIVIMHASGQLFAAHVYLRALVVSIAAVLTTLLVVSVIKRLLMLYRSKLLREAREARQEDDAEGSVDDDAPERSLDALASLSEAHNQLLSLARLLTLASLLWLIWSPALPALSVFDSITLWTVVDSGLPEGELRNVTLSVLLLAAIALIVTGLLTRHLPPLVNVLLLEWTQVSAGGRYATGMLMQYLIIGVGGAIALGMLGFEWSKVQWLVAALGVGIGFGLQEIVANFISGLIVLFERPIRVGDIINAGGHDGVVRNINPRATVVETFEGKEVMIPNKELITNVVTNWTLDSSRLRLVIPVGIAYGSDVPLAMRLLLEVARDDAEVLEDPAPIVTFEDFGDNALVLWLRCYASKDYPVVTSRLRVSIYAAYENAGISIAFPQRDVHLDASGPIPVRVVRDEGADA